MSLYEWCLYLERLEFNNKKELNHTENLWGMCRVIWAAIMNRFRGKGEPTYKPQDLIKLSFDKEQEKKKDKPDLKKALQNMGSKFKLDGK